MKKKLVQAVEEDMMQVSALLLDEDKRFKRQMEIAEALVAKDPSLGFIPAIVMAGDLAVAERIDVEFQAGRMPFKTAQALMGSYARFDWCVKQFQAGKVNPEVFYSMLPDLWMGSDPDDTKLEYLAVFKKARALNGKYIRDGKNLPRGTVLTVYRGQDRLARDIGLSWSLKPGVALKFARGAWARQSNRDGVVMRGYVNKKDVLAYLTGRGEEEVLCSAADVKDIERFDLFDRYDMERLNEIIKGA